MELIEKKPWGPTKLEPDDLDMRIVDPGEPEEEEEPEINPCRGCKDYDWRGGCKSNGGCGMDFNDSNVLNALDQKEVNANALDEVTE